MTLYKILTESQLHDHVLNAVVMSQAYCSSKYRVPYHTQQSISIKYIFKHHEFYHINYNLNSFINQLLKLYNCQKMQLFPLQVNT